MIRFCWITVAVTVLLAPSWGQDSQKTLPSARYSEAFEAVWRDIDQNFYDPSFLGVNWTEAGARYRAKLPGIKSDADFEKLIDQMLRELPTSHLHFRVAVNSKAMTPSTLIGAMTNEIDGKNVVVNVEPTSDAAVEGMHPGDILLTKEQNLRGPWGSRVNLEVEHCNGKVEQLSVTREPWGWPFDRPSVRWKIVERTDKLEFGYLRITHFEDDLAPLIDRAMREMDGTAGIIIDLRFNTGGNASYVRLMSYLAPHPRAAFILLSRPFLNRFGKAPEQLSDAVIAQIPKVAGAYTTNEIIDAFRKNGGGAAFYTEDVGQNFYKGKIVLLVNKETASAAEAFAREIKGWPRVTIVGQSTAGAIVGAEDFNIPGGWTLTLPTHATWTSNGKLYRDQETAPDIEIPEDRESLCQSKDVAMDRAIGFMLQ